MAFTPQLHDSGKWTRVKMVASQTVAAYDALAEDGNGYYQRATSGASLCRFVAVEGRTDSGSNDDLLVIHTAGVKFIADTNAAPAQTDVGTTADLTDHDTLDESASSNDVFFIEEILGATTDQKVLGYFVTDKAS